MQKITRSFTAEEEKSVWGGLDNTAAEQSDRLWNQKG